MTCYSPLTLYRSRAGRDKVTGKWPLVGLKQGYHDMPEQVPCSRCIGCRLERSRQWGIRCVHEAQMHDENAFLTLTYRDEELLYYGGNRPTLYPRHLQLFLKRYRKEFGNGIRFFACGEYGERYNRPHYHAIIFGHSFPDQEYYTTTKAGHKLRTSCMLDSLWSHGNTLIGDVSFESAAYVARYIMGKKLGFGAQYYKEHDIEPEFVRMSRGGRSGQGGIGLTWFDKYYKDVFPQDRCIIRGGIKSKPPRYYSQKFELLEPEQYERIKAKRKIAIQAMGDETSGLRLRTKEIIKYAQIASLRK